MNTFDRKFGGGFLDGLPDEPGVYRFLDAAGAVIYVGKAKRLRRRLAQYRLASRRTKHRRMRRIVRAASSIAWEQTPSHLDACLLEVCLIQALRPRWNVAGAFSGRYPYIGLGADGGQLRFACTTQPQRLPGLRFFGAYRSRDVCGEAFFSLMRLLTFVGHRTPAKRPAAGPGSRYAYVHSFRRLPEAWGDLWTALFNGSSRGALEDLALRLLDNAGARSRAASIQEDLDALRRFWDDEALPLARAIAATDYSDAYPVPQAARDPLFIRYRMMRGEPGPREALRDARRASVAGAEPDGREVGRRLPVGRSRH